MIIVLFFYILCHILNKYNICIMGWEANLTRAGLANDLTKIHAIS